MAAPFVLWIDTANNKLAAGWNSFVWSLPPLFKQGDTIDILIRLIKRPTTYGAGMDEAPWPTGDVTIDIGNKALPPVGGKWYLNFIDSTSEIFDYNIDAEALENALNSMPDIVSAGGVSVSGLNGDGFKIIFSENGEQPQMTGQGEALVPTSRVIINQISDGSETTKAVYWIYLRQATVSEVIGTWQTEEPSVPIAAELNPSIWDVYLSSQPKDGSFTITLNGGEPIQIPVNATEEMFSAAIGTGYSVKKQGDYLWRIISDSGAFVVEIDDWNIVSFSGKTAKLRIDDQKCSEMLAGITKTETSFEISINDGENHQTILSAPCTVVGKLTQ